jgi:hypothetical protein
MINNYSKRTSTDCTDYYYLKPLIVCFFKQEFSGFFGSLVIDNIADAIIDIFEKNIPAVETFQHGQLFWNALDKSTRADSPNRKYKPVTLSLVHSDDIARFEKKNSIYDLRKQVIARLINEAFRQGGILSMRDLSLIFATNDVTCSRTRQEYEDENKTVLPHTGVIHDMGSTISHNKVVIVFKHVVEKKPTNIVARETNHSQRAVDHYINDYFRVKTLVDDNKNIDFIHLTTNIAKCVVIQYINIIKLIQENVKRF